MEESIRVLVQNRDPLILENKKLFCRALETCIYIQPFGETYYERLKLNNSQHRFIDLYFEMKLAGVPIRIIILKGRRQGLTTICAAIATFEMWIRAGMRCAVAAHVKERVTQYIYLMYKSMIERMPMSEGKAKQRLGWGHTLIENESYIRVEVEADVVGVALDFLHLSEASRFRNLDGFLGAIRPTLPLTSGTALIIESTALRYGDGFHQQWLAAERNESNFEPLFLAWYTHELNKVAFEDEAEEQEFQSSLTHSADEQWGDEATLFRNPEISLENLKWRRGILKDTPLTEFYREYPSTPEEAFLQTDANVFDAVILKDMRNRAKAPQFQGEMEIEEPLHWQKPPSFIPQRPPLLRMWAPPHPEREYVIGSDHSLGRHDFNCAVVLQRRPLVVVAVLRGYDGRNLIPLEFAKQYYHLYHYYNDAYLNPECNDSGAAVIASLLEWGCAHLLTHDSIFPHTNTQVEEYGWRNTTTTRVEAIEKLRYAIVNNLIQIPDAMLIDEMMQFIYKASGTTNREKAEAARKGEYRKPGESEFGFYDDRVFALMGAYLGHLALANPKSERNIRVERGQVMHERLYPEDELQPTEWNYDPRDEIGLEY